MITVVDKASHQSRHPADQEFTLDKASVVKLALRQADVKSLVRSGETLTVTLASGQVIVVHRFFPALPERQQENDLVLADDDGLLWLAESAEGEPFAAQYRLIDSVEPLLYQQGDALFAGGWDLLMPGLLGGLALGGGGGAGAGTVGGAPASSTPIDTTAPAAPTVTAFRANVDGTLSVSGQAESGATVRVTFADGSTGSMAADANGRYGPITSSRPQASGTVTATATDAAGNTSIPATQTYTKAPTSATANADGTEVSGLAEPGGTVTVKDALGHVLGSALVAADGTFTVVLSKAQTDGQLLSVTAAEAGGTSAPVTAAAPDITPAAAPVVVSIDAAGTELQGSGEPGSTVTVKDAQGNTLGTACCCCPESRLRCLHNPQAHWLAWPGVSCRARWL